MSTEYSIMKGLRIIEESLTSTHKPLPRRRLRENAGIRTVSDFTIKDGVEHLVSNMSFDIIDTGESIDEAIANLDWRQLPKSLKDSIAILVLGAGKGQVEQYNTKASQVTAELAGEIANLMGDIDWQSATTDLIDAHLSDQDTFRRAMLDTDAGKRWIKYIDMDINDSVYAYTDSDDTDDHDNTYESRTNRNKLVESEEDKEKLLALLVKRYGPVEGGNCSAENLKKALDAAYAAGKKCASKKTAE